ncbi:zinc metallopeptidase, putative [Talaromyces stipitatus ATCC 10500]|uniref:Zinc metallopeptidase, putative n=1 Tax=Talaromyces stipitatus (strain ATCC 10500 / CBS 375.48 / QM 6759 / NRRL 1006) TaxID=441959 RepID=B8MH91_TALSN|nr:zinc metallopeptidase, putative [Talaromyces stipitatus ATCC 10500]EED17070.1 zinc metallopeptidase, putative [Talaromyces stipitatus ATCC 10500]
MPTGHQIERLVGNQAHANYRGDIVENRHKVHAAIVDANGQFLYRVGDPSRVTLIRSAAKPAQALAILEAGVFDRFPFDDADLALMCASHSSEDMHVSRAQSMLAKVQILETDLRCGGHPAISETVNRAWIKADYTPTGICNNCSGKHVGMIAGAKCLGADIADYHLPENPMQLLVRRVVEELTDLHGDEVKWGIDGCNLPAPAVPLYSLAKIYGTLAAADRTVDKDNNAPTRSQNLACVFRAMAQHPELVGGEGRFCTRLMTGFEGQLVGKIGAEGCYGIGIRPTEYTKNLGTNTAIGIAVKIEDGNIPILYSAVMGILEQLSIGTSEAREKLADFHRPRLLNTAGVEIGHVVCAFKVQAMREFDPLVLQYQHDKHRPREDEALHMLKKIASLVKPIMRQRNWKVGTLAEFYPSARTLLGVNTNRGEKICLRLRYASDEYQFLALDHVVDTMLHELCHIVHGPHNTDFHALWNQLRDEYTELAMKGYTGEGFLSQGNRLGGSKIPLEEARRVARTAAQRRALAAGSVQKLGGAPLMKGSDIRKIIADAAQKRIDVTKGCASGSSEGEKLADEASRNGFRTKAKEDDANERAIMEAYIEMIQEEEKEKYGTSYVPPSQENPAGPRGRVYPPGKRPRPSPTETKPIKRFASSGTLSGAFGASDENIPDIIKEDQRPWNCRICTLENPPAYLCCDACGIERPTTSLTAQSRLVAGPDTKWSNRGMSKPRNRLGSEVDSSRVLSFKSKTAERISSLEQDRAMKPLGWLCDKCGAFMETEWWTCSACGMMKTTS